MNILASSFRRRFVRAKTFAPLVAFLSCLTTTAVVHAQKGPEEWAMISLDYARKEKVDQLRRFCDRVHAKAKAAAVDPILLDSFKIFRSVDELERNGDPPPSEMKSKVHAFRKALNGHYIRNYLAFYDILFVNRGGNVFFSIRGESDLHRDLGANVDDPDPLEACVSERPDQERFVDFFHYGASDEPAAFFVEPLRIDGEMAGWLVLQCAINKINSLFIGAELPGRTGEAFLANHEGYMLSESNFEVDSTILRKKLADRNIKAKFAERRGHRRVTDYRGYKALSSFEVFEFMGIRWLVVIKIDEAEVVTEHYIRHRRYFMDRIIDFLKKNPAPAGSRNVPSTTSDDVVRVDMDEFARTTKGKTLHTWGVATCTGLVAGYPGKFGYLAHISPADKVYGGDGTNLLSYIIKHITTYDIYKYERRQVRFHLVVNHFESLPRIVERLVDAGFMLSQIDVLYNAEGRSAAITYDYRRDELRVDWLKKGGAGETFFRDGVTAWNLGEIVKLETLKTTDVANDLEFNSNKEVRERF